MKISQTGLNLIKSFEGCRLTAYKCPAGVWTIGYGHTAGVHQGMKISQTQADAFLIEDMKKYEAKVNKYMSKYNFNQNQYDAMVSFAYNVGSVDGLTAYGTRTIAQISAKFPAYNLGGGKILSGLVRRRAAEKALFDKPCAITVEKPVETKPASTVKTQTMTVSTKGSNLNLRSEANAKSKVLASIPNKTKIEVLDKSNKNWYKVKFKEVTGFVSSKYLK